MIRFLLSPNIRRIFITMARELRIWRGSKGADVCMRYRQKALQWNAVRSPHMEM
jgi:hypothetical protein